MSARGHTVSQVARLAHVTVRTLHHYDEIGLLVPSDRSQAGYRLYSDDDLARLHQILLFRELGFSLEAIAQVLDEPPADQRSALKSQRDRLVMQRQRTDAVIRAVDAALEALEKGRPMPTDKMFEGFEDFDHQQYADEARERWGETEAYQESARRTKSYGKSDWAAMRAESERSMKTFAALLERGVAPVSPEAMDAAEEARLLIDRWFYPCSKAMHATLGEMYVADPRFTATYENIKPGLAAFVSAAIKANAARP